MIKAVLFDLDGVLIDSQLAWFNLFNSMAEFFGTEKVTREHFNSKLWGTNTREAAQEHFSHVDFREVDNFVRKNLLNFIEHISAMPDVENVLKEIRKKPLKLATATNTPTQLTVAILERLNLRNYFDLIMTRDEVEEAKPSPAMILKACERLNIKPDEAIFIGDTESDKTAADKANCPFIGYRLNADKRIDDLKELLKII